MGGVLPSTVKSVASACVWSLKKFENNIENIANINKTAKLLIELEGN